MTEVSVQAPPQTSASPQAALPVRFAGFWIRAVAEILDSVILTVASWVVELALLRLFYLIWKLSKGGTGVEIPAFDDAFNSLFLQMFNIGIYLCLAFPYYVWGHFKYGTTLGKRPFRIYVVDHATLGSLTIAQSITRFFAYGISYALFMTGFIMAAFHPQKRALHDLMAKTASVIKKDRVRTETIEVSSGL
jgi:uncharacterized RDD family membrane protein YckC